MRGDATSSEVTANVLTPLVLFLMGVTGSGKTTLGLALGEAWRWPYRDADDYHPPENVEKMRTGVPLTDDDREPWLLALHALAAETLAEGGGVIIGCSALKAAYRRRLRGSLERVVFVWLDLPADILQQRLRARQGHFMPASLLASQLATLEPPRRALRVNGDQPVPALVAEITSLVSGVR